MKDIFRKIFLTLLILTNNAIFSINEFVCKSNFFRKLHPSNWSWVKRFVNSKFTKTFVNFFKISCNSISNIWGLEPIFENKIRETRVDNISFFTRNLFNRSIENINQADVDNNRWASLVYSLEKSKLFSACYIASFIDAWYEDVKSKRSDSEKTYIDNPAHFVLSSTDDSLNLNNLKKNYDAVYCLSEVTQSVLLNFESLDKSKPIVSLCPEKGCFDKEIRQALDCTTKLQTSMEKDLFNYDCLIAKVSDNVRTDGPASASSSLAPSM